MTHIRTAIRDEVNAALLTELTVAKGWVVFKGRVYDLGTTAGTKVAISYPVSEEIEREVTGHISTRVLTLAVVIIVKAKSAVYTTVDTGVELAEIAMVRANIPSADDVQLVSTTWTSSAGEQQNAEAALEYQILYRTAEGAPSTGV